MLFRVLLGLVLTWRARHAAQPVREPWTAGSDLRASSAITMPLTFRRDHSAARGLCRMERRQASGGHVA
jgi:hypothetical protein